MNEHSVHVILNPTAGGGAGGRRRREIERELAARGVAFTLEETHGIGHAVELAGEAVARGVGTIVAAGGDGTIHEVANGMLEAHEAGRGALPTLAIVPVGTGNDFAKMVDGAADRRRVYDVVAAGEVRRFDIGRVSWRGGGEYFINSMGTGVDVEVVRQRERLPRLPGVLAYGAALLKALIRFRAVPLRAVFDGEAIEQKAMILAVGNGACIGGGFHICPDAVPDDGRFDACIISELTVPQLARVVPRIMRGTHCNLPQVGMRQAETIEIEAMGDESLFFQFDGELREPAGAKRLRVELWPAALPVLAAAPARPPREPR